MPKLKQYLEKYRIKPGSNISLKDFDSGHTGDFATKTDTKDLLAQGIQQLIEYQDRLYAQNTCSLLIIFQALDAAGKDSTIKHVMSGLNPQGTVVHSFKAPSIEELDHDYLWRCVKALPERGRIGIFNRSYYEEVLVVRVHPEFLEKQNLPLIPPGDKIWKRRFQEINNFERYMTDNGTTIVKFFLNVSKEEQKKRFLERIELTEKNWKFSTTDIKERSFWDDYQIAFEDVFNHTSTHWAPWYIIPADHKWFTRLAVAEIIIEKMQELDPQYPVINDTQKQELLEAKSLLENEAG